MEQLLTGNFVWDCLEDTYLLEMFQKQCWNQPTKMVLFSTKLVDVGDFNSTRSEPPQSETTILSLFNVPSPDVVCGKNQQTEVNCIEPCC